MSNQTIFRSVAKDLSTLRKKRQLSQEKIAAAAGIKQPTVSDIERGITRHGWVALAKIAGALGTSLEEVIFDKNFEDHKFTKPQRELILNVIRGITTGM